MWIDTEQWGGISIWVDDKTGKVMRGTKGSGWDEVAIYPYEKQGGGFTNCSGLYTLKQMLNGKKIITWA